MKAPLLLVVALSIAPAAAFPREGDRCEVPAVGSYSNSQYNFALVVPKGREGRNPAVCDVDENGQCICWGSHGLVIRLGENATIVALGEFATEMENPTLEGILREEQESLSSLGAHVLIEPAHEIQLSGQTGYRIRGTYSNDGVRMQFDRHLFWTGARVTISLFAPTDAFPTYVPEFEEALNSWRWTSTQTVDGDAPQAARPPP